MRFESQVASVQTARIFAKFEGSQDIDQQVWAKAPHPHRLFGRLLGEAEPVGRQTEKRKEANNIGHCCDKDT